MIQTPDLLSHTPASFQLELWAMIGPAV